MKPEEMIKGQFYFIKQKDIKENWIVRFDRIEDVKVYFSNFILQGYNNFWRDYKTNWGYIHDIETIRLANHVEILHLEECYRQGKYVNLKKVVVNYEIY